MERDEVLKKLGFTEMFLNALKVYDTSVPNTYYKIPFDDFKNEFSIDDSTDQLIIDSNDMSTQNIIIDMA